MTKALVLSLALTLFASSTFAECNFKTGEFIKELGDPSFIDAIDIEVAKSSSFAKNFFKIITTNGSKIDQSLKKKFKAIVSVKYPFGECYYAAKVRQNGDFKDHLGFSDQGVMQRSLDVKLKNGNIAGSVHFKLLIPETRGGKNEIISSLILRYLGFIAPETFEVLSNLNGHQSVMLFQENANKELLERNKRREGPIFKGDEDLLFGYEDFNDFLLLPLALSRTVNPQWFLKGNSSQWISISSYLKLQSSYLEFSTSIPDRLEVIIDPNGSKSDLFEYFDLTLLAMNGHHGLSPNNRRFYYNALTSEFEPIYYDGNVDYSESTWLKYKNIRENILPRLFANSVDEAFFDIFLEQSTIDSLKHEFEKRVKFEEQGAGKFVEITINSFLDNASELTRQIINQKPQSLETISKQSQLDSYIEFQNIKNVPQTAVVDLRIFGDKFKATLLDGTSTILNKEEVSVLISDNLMHGSRAILLPNETEEWLEKPLEETIVPGFSGRIITASGIKVSFSSENRQIIFEQTSNDDWVLISGGKFNNWKIFFQGQAESTLAQSTDQVNNADDINQRFNKYGVTGCLTFLNVNFINTQVALDDGRCEDSLNIINSQGSLSRIVVNNAHSDAIDIDFSDIEVSAVKVNNAGNDCIDLSGGNYILNIIELSDCTDKGISIGEQSSLLASRLDLESSNIGVSSKDLSKVEIGRADISKSAICTEVKQKKQEFGGAYLNIQELNCGKTNNVDIHSVLLRGNL